MCHTYGITYAAWLDGERLTGAAMKPTRSRCSRHQPVHRRKEGLQSHVPAGNAHGPERVSGLASCSSTFLCARRSCRPSSCYAQHGSSFVDRGEGLFGRDGADVRHRERTGKASYEQVRGTNGGTLRRRHEMRKEIVALCRQNCESSKARRRKNP